MTHLLSEGNAVKVWGEDDAPEGFVWKNASHTIVEVSNVWRVHTRWWEPRQVVWREYWKVVTDTGLLCQIYRDMENGGWFIARVYD
jgi:hypothetical protein